MSASFSGGGNLKGILDRMTSSLKNELSVQVGFMEDATCGPNNDAHAPSVAFWNEFGTLTADGKQHIPPRPFFRTMIQRYSPSWGRLLMAALKHANYNQHKAFSIAGQKMEDQLQRQIEETLDPPNAESTIKGKGGKSHPLINSGNLKRSVTYRVLVAK